MIQLKLGETAHLQFENAINESQALAQLRSSFPQLLQGNVKKLGWQEISKEEYDLVKYIGCEKEISCDNDRYYMRNRHLDEHYDPEIKLIENV